MKFAIFAELAREFFVDCNSVYERRYYQPSMHEMKLQTRVICEW